jgi:hydroxycarboxylate dehydrogenase B
MWTVKLKRLLAGELTAQAATVFIATGCSAEDAQLVASNLVEANLRGHDSHGIGMLPRYVDAVLEGGLDPRARTATLLDSGALLRLDGQRGYGQVVGLQAINMACERAKAQGSCILSLARAHHLGRIGHFAEAAAARGLVSIHFVNVLSRPIVAPWGGADARFGTNPVCIGVPLPGREPFILDFATSRVAQGKMRVAHNRGEAVEAGLLIDAQGQPTTDPAVVVSNPPGLFGAILPFGEHKGSGLAIACELLAGALTGGGTWHQEPSGSRAVLNSMLSIVIDPAALGTQEYLEREALAFVQWLQQSPVATGHAGVLLAGEPERATRARRMREGIEVDAQTWNEIEAAAAKLGVRLNEPVT